MSRKAELLKECDAYAKKITRGLQSTKKERKRILTAIVNDLVYLKVAPVSFRQIDEKTIKTLVNFWKEQNKAKKTLLNRLVIFRGFMTTCFPQQSIPGNQALMIPSSSPKYHENPLLNIPIETVRERLTNPVTRSILDFQLYFGLTRMESIRVSNLAIKKDSFQLCIDRAIAANRHDRYIPILTNQQYTAIHAREEILGHRLKLSDIAKEAEIAKFFKVDCLLKKIPFNFPFHAYYVKSRYDYLTNNLTHSQAMKQIKEEIGYLSDKKVEELLRNVYE